MHRFAQLYNELDATTRTNEKVAALQRYFSAAPPEDAAWGLHFLLGRKTPRLASSPLLRQWAADDSRLPLWLVDECHDAVGDLGETLALLVPGSSESSVIPLHAVVEQRILGLREMPEEWRREVLLKTWRELNTSERLVFNKLITGSFRVGVSATLVARALALIAGLPQAVMAHRLMRAWTPRAEDFRQLLRAEEGAFEPAQPYPFYLASPMTSPSEALGSLAHWLVEWKWDGLRAQVIRRQGQVFICSRGEELVTATFPEIAEAARRLNDGTVLDGEILAWRDEHPLPFGALQRRIGRKDVAADFVAEWPVVFQGFDLLEWEGKDWRTFPLADRRQKLETIFKDIHSNLPFRISPAVRASSWDELASLQRESRARGVEGLMLKRWSSAYGVGRPRGDWWKWKIDPHVIDAVLIYAQPGHGRRATLFTDYTFGLWQEDKLVPVAKAYSGLTDDEIREVDAFVRRHTVNKFGPVRIVKPELVFELAFEGLRESSRHKSGLAVRFPRMNRWRRDKKPDDADTLETLRAMLPPHSTSTGKPIQTN
jgi:DNA ligase-1